MRIQTDQEWFSALFLAHYGTLLNIGALMLNNRSTAEDLVNETFLILWSKRAQLRNHSGIAGASDEGITKMIGRWTDETFHFGGIGRESTSEEVPVDVKSGIEGNYDSIEAALSACEITQDVFPKWIPDRFHLEEIYVRQLGTGFCAVSADYSCAGTSRIFTVDIMKFDTIADASSYVFEKDDAPVIEYECGGVNHYLIHNPAGDAVIWNNGDLVCSITGDLTTEEFQKAIDSIYKE